MLHKKRLPRPVLYRFKDYRFDTSRGSLCRAGLEVALRPKCFEVLRLLLDNPKRLISKQELIEVIWPDVVVTDESIARAVSDLRAAIGDDTHSIIKTMPRRGYVFDETVSSEGKISALGLFPADTGLPVGARDNASIAVLPFLNLNGDRRQDYIADGLTEDITTELSRFSALLVIARNSTFQYKGKSADVRQIGRDLGARYVLEGSIRRNGRRVRIAAQLIEASSGSHRWAERFDTNVEQLLAVQDEVVRSIVAVLAAHLNRAEIERTLSKPMKPPNNLGLVGYPPTTIPLHRTFPQPAPSNKTIKSSSTAHSARSVTIFFIHAASVPRHFTDPKT